MTWLELNKILMQLDEHGVRGLLDDELRGKRRQTYLLRIHKRYNILRAKRERAEMKKPR